VVVDNEKDKPGSVKEISAREANGTWLSHEETSEVAKMFRRVKAMLPSINFESSEKWQILSYYPGGHYAPHFDYITYTSPKQWSYWMKNYGQRMATFLLMLQPATKGGGTLFPKLRATVMPSRGDAIFWANMNATGGKVECSGNSREPSTSMYLFLRRS
ncbi:oxidoreductase, 2OG-Fe(II) oxygenase family protein, partial [Cooperia oncophora]